MWIEAILAKEDLVTVLNQFLPVKIHLDDDESTDRWLYLDRPTEVELVADKGLRVACPAELMWSIAMVDVPVKLHTLRLLLRPEIVAKKRGHILAFNIELEEADIKGIPSLVDHTIMKAVNAALASKELAWDFTDTLSHTFAMPKMLEPINALALRVTWGKRRVDEKALVLAVSFEVDVKRGD